MFAIRNGINPEHMIWEMDMARVNQLMLAECVRNGGNMRWAVYFPNPEIEAAMQSPRDMMTISEMEAQSELI